MAAVHPLSALLLAAAGFSAAVTSARGAVVAGFVLLGWALSRGAGARQLAGTLLPLASGFLLLAALAPWAPGAVGRTVVQGLAASLAVVVALGAAGANLLLAYLAPALPAAAVAFALVLVRQLEEMRRDTARAFDALALRGGFDRWANRGRAVGVLLEVVVARSFARADRAAAVLAARAFEGRLPPIRTWRAREEAPQLAALLPLAATLVWELGPWRR